MTAWPAEEQYNPQGGRCIILALNRTLGWGSENGVSIEVKYPDNCYQGGRKNCSLNFGVYVHEEGEFFYSTALNFPGISIATGEEGRVHFYVLQKQVDVVGTSMLHFLPPLFFQLPLILWTIPPFQYS